MVAMTVIEKVTGSLITGKKIRRGLTLKEHKSFVVTLGEDPETKDLIMPFPVELLSQMGWAEGTDLWWEVQENGTVTITEVKKIENPNNNFTSTITKE
jgi:hypothetical protein